MIDMFIRSFAQITPTSIEGYSGFKLFRRSCTSCSKLTESTTAGVKRCPVRIFPVELNSTHSNPLTIFGIGARICRLLLNAVSGDFIWVAGGPPLVHFPERVVTKITSTAPDLVTIRSVLRLSCSTRNPLGILFARSLCVAKLLTRLAAVIQPIPCRLIVMKVRRRFGLLASTAVFRCYYLISHATYASIVKVWLGPSSGRTT